MKILPWSLRLMEPRLKLRRRPSTWQLLRPCGEEEKADARRSMLLAEGLPAAPPALKVVFYLWNTHTHALTLTHGVVTGYHARRVVFGCFRFYSLLLLAYFWMPMARHRGHF